MSLWVDIAKLAVAVNALLLLALLAVWGRNYVEFRSKHALGLATFGFFLFAENAFALYFYLMDPMLAGWFNSSMPAPAWRALMTLHVTQSVALAALLWITLD
jgi:hypothetical protein